SQRCDDSRTGAVAYIDHLKPRRTGGHIGEVAVYFYVVGKTRNGNKGERSRYKSLDDSSSLGSEPTVADRNRAGSSIASEYMPVHRAEIANRQLAGGVVRSFAS